MTVSPSASPSAGSTTSAAPTAAPPGGARASGALLVVGFVLLSLNTRVAFGQVGPLAPVAGFSSGTVTLLGLLPPLCMGLFAPLGAFARRHYGAERGLFGASAVLVVGAVLRMAGMAGLVAGTVLVSLATAVVNVLVPVWVHARFAPRRVGTMMGVYALSMGIGSAVVAALVVPVAQAGGGAWQPAIGIAVVPALLALVGIAPQAVRRRTVPAPATATSGAVRRRPVARTALGWSLTAFFGLQTLMFYTTLAWLPSVLVAAGTSRTAAGTYQAVFILGIAAGGFAAPALAGRRTDQRPHIAAAIAVPLFGFAGLLLAPAAAPGLWAAVLGVGLGAAQSLAGVLYVRRGTDPQHVTALSAMAQTCGYLVAATGPALAAWLHATTGSWQALLTSFLGLLAVNAVLSMRAGHDPR
ncbi:MFS transporter [Streptomyces niger]|uniref:MFS transporter n=1 Tax=Streptomyces niger TaxID=66373 RepID=UPI00069C9A07|nr:MFS transporter [Streptomyces niger]